MEKKGCIISLQDWFVRYRHSDPFLAPEMTYTVLAGAVFGHPKKPDGSLVKTSAIEKIDGRIITTESGSVYRLGRINRKYRRWIRKEGFEYDPKNPIKDRRAQT